MDKTFNFPVAGIDQSHAFFKQWPRQILPSSQGTTTAAGQPVVDGIAVEGQKDPQFWGATTISGQNVRSFDPGQNRKRGGSRAGLSRYVPMPPSGTNIVQCLTSSVNTQPMQTNSAGRVVTLVAVSQGNVYWALAGDQSWSIPVNATTPLATPPLIFSGIIRSAVSNQIVYFADGTNWVQFSPTANTVTTWAPGTQDLLGNPITSVLPVDSAGNKPRLIVNWRNRICLAGLLNDPQTIFMSAQGDPYNFDYSPESTTPTQAVALDASAPAGYVGDVVTCLIPYTNDVMYAGGDHSLYMINGDPMAGGHIDLVSSSIGVAFGTPWCMDPYGAIYFVSNKTGIYTVMPGQQPQRISQQIEALLANIDTGLTTITMLWNDRFQGVHVFMTPTGQSTSLAITAANVPQQPVMHLFYELRTGAWWQDRFENPDHNPLCCVTFDGNAPGDRVALIGSWDGFVRAIDPFATSDDGYPIDSSVVLGPILTPDMDDMLVHELQAVLGELSGQVDYKIFVGRTAEEALGNEPVDSGTWVAGRNPVDYVRRSGHAIYLELSAANSWSMEQVRVRISGLGKVRRRSPF